MLRINEHKGYKMATALIGLIGRKGSGKDTGAQVLLDQGYKNVKLADPLKGMLRYLLQYQGVDTSNIERMIEGDLKEVPTEFLAGHTPRHAMQTLGTEWGRVCMGENFWALMVVPATKDKNSVVTDVRFPNEVHTILNAGGMVYGIAADWIEPTPGEHASEAQIDSIIASLPAHRTVINSRLIGCDPNTSINAFKARFAEAVCA